MRTLSILLVLSVLLGCGSGKPFPDLVGAVMGSDDRTADGLREALEVATTRAVDLTSQAGGFSADDVIRIELPDALDDPVRALRSFGLGGFADDLEAGMNLAAERAVAEATPLFVDAIGSLTFADAQRILQGGETAATDYFRSKTEPRLVDRFRPEVEASMQNVGLYREYEALLGAYQSLPLTEKPNLDLAEYVTDHTVDGLFDVLGREEARIREDPVARTTELLREVFGK